MESSEDRIELAVVIPTLDDRVDIYQHVRAAYMRTLAGVDARIVTIRNAKSCGEGWQKGADAVNMSALQPQYMHFGADDLEPRDGWFEAGKEAVSWGAVPGAHIMRPNGTLESNASWETPGETKTRADLARVPFCSWEQWQKIKPIPYIQYYSDNAFHDRAAKNGWPCLIHNGYRFIHHRPLTGRPGEQEQMINDQRLYQQWRKDHL